MSPTPPSSTSLAPPVIRTARRHFEKAGGTLRASAAIRAGIHPRTLYAMRDAGIIVPISRGLYRLADAAPLSNPDLVVVAQQVPRSVVCLVSALAFHGLTMQIPHQVDVALAPGSRTPAIDHPPIRVFRFGGRSRTTGVERHMIDGVPVRVFNPAKTVADCFKFRNRIGTDIAGEALRSYLRRRGSTADELLRFADIDRVRGVMMPYIEAAL
ncbi:MAG: type IV toxin-antitoxin system AbiEi family antitoxin domain-containing protein [Phycisphaeraceae bacterium]|nr:type IV toxin-antitoxin system AbiEi family antitoxin domain-containing protein [Phycisphaerae bacterium]MBX3391111.1 type IV toxin-antitoxin system AbiEi family antitoxin domain-containing protein [Phycisphaeraceae bacterium]